jgi:hypothetical protein
MKPKSLLERCADDCVGEFQIAARQRSRDAAVLADARRGVGAIYLWGYAVEMILKAAYFRLIGFHDRQTIDRHDLFQAAKTAQTIGVVWLPPSNFHNLRAWVELLVRSRASKPSSTYLSPRFAQDVVDRTLKVQRFWNETLRYRKNVAFEWEVREVREGAAWLISHSELL